jgi:hypothetical protein
LERIWKWTPPNLSTIPAFTVERLRKTVKYSVAWLNCISWFLTEDFDIK